MAPENFSAAASPTTDPSAIERSTALRRDRRRAGETRGFGAFSKNGAVAAPTSPVGASGSTSAMLGFQVVILAPSQMRRSSVACSFASVKR
jgi:hypothetical protein